MQVGPIGENSASRRRSISSKKSKGSDFSLGKVDTAAFRHLSSLDLGSESLNEKENATVAAGLDRMLNA